MKKIHRCLLLVICLASSLSGSAGAKLAVGKHYTFQYVVNVQAFTDKGQQKDFEFQIGNEIAIFEVNKEDVKFFDIADNCARITISTKDLNDYLITSIITDKKVTKKV